MMRVPGGVCPGPESEGAASGAFSAAKTGAVTDKKRTEENLKCNEECKVWRKKGI